MPGLPASGGCAGATVPKRLAVQLTLSLTLLVVAIEVVLTFSRLRDQEQQILERMILGADQLSRSIASATWHAMLADNRATAYEVMQTIAKKEGIDRIRIFNKEGRIMFSTGSDRGGLVDKKAEACFVCHASGSPLVRVDVPGRARIYREPGGKRELGLITPIYNEAACSSAACHAHPGGIRVLGVLDVSLELDPVDREMAGMRRTALIEMGVVVLLIALVTVYFTRRFVQRPIAELIEGTKAVAEMQLDRPIEIDSSVELGELARSFNVMRERLKQAVAQLNELAQELESRVEERTAQLGTAQQRLIRADRLASLGQLSASVAHEINNPLSGILNLTKLMQRIAPDGVVPPERRAEFLGYLQEVSQETARVGRTVADLLAFSRRSKPQRGPADLNAVVRKTLSLVGHKLDLAEVRVALDLAEGLPPVPCDASQIQQVVMNLVLNGAEAITGGGTVTVATRRVAGADSVALEVYDTGSGIAPEHLPDLFTPFFTTKEEGKGVGLGLAVVYGIVHAHGGEIEVESKPGEGSLFRVTLPLTPPEEGPAAGGASPAGEGEETG